MSVDGELDQLWRTGLASIVPATDPADVPRLHRRGSRRRQRRRAASASGLAVGLVVAVAALSSFAAAPDTVTTDGTHSPVTPARAPSAGATTTTTGVPGEANEPERGGTASPGPAASATGPPAAPAPEAEPAPDIGGGGQDGPTEAGETPVSAPPVVPVPGLVVFELTPAGLTAAPASLPAGEYPLDFDASGEDFPDRWFLLAEVVGPDGTKYTFQRGFPTHRKLLCPGQWTATIIRRAGEPADVGAIASTSFVVVGAHPAC